MELLTIIKVSNYQTSKIIIILLVISISTSNLKRGRFFFGQILCECANIPML